MTMRAVFLVPAFPVRTETFVAAQVDALRGRGWTVDVLPEIEADGDTHASARRTAAALARGIASAPAVTLRALDVIAHGRRAADGRLLRDADRIAAGPPPDVVHAHFGESGLRGLALRRIGACSAPLVTTFYGHDVSSFVATHGASVYDTLRAGGDRFLALGPAMRARLAALGFDAARTAEQPLVVDCAAFSPMESGRTPGPRGGGDAPLRIATIARFVPKKGLHDAIAVTARLRAAGLAVQHTVAGDGPLRDELAALAASAGVADIVSFPGFLGRADVARLLRASDVLLAPSRTAPDGDTEGTPAVILEAMACGAAVVATRHAGIPDIVSHDADGLLAGEGDVAALADAVRRLGGDAALRARLAAAARHRVLARNDVAPATDLLLANYAAAARVPRQP